MPYDEFFLSISGNVQITFIFLTESITIETLKSQPTQKRSVKNIALA